MFSICLTPFRRDRVFSAPRSNAHHEVFAVLMTGVRPVEREFDLRAFWKRLGQKIGEMNSQAVIKSLNVLARFPIISGPTDDHRSHRIGINVKNKS